MGKNEGVEAVPPSGAPATASVRRGWKRRGWRRRGARQRNVIIASVASFLLLPLAFALAAAWDGNWLQGLRGAYGAADPIAAHKNTTGRTAGHGPGAGPPGGPAAFPGAGDGFSVEASAALVQVATNLSSDALALDPSLPFTKLASGPAESSASPENGSTGDGAGSPTPSNTVLPGQPPGAAPEPGSFAGPMPAPAIAGLPGSLPSLSPVRFARPPAGNSTPAPTVATLQPDPPPGKTPSPGAADGPGSASDAPPQSGAPTKPTAIPEPPSLAAFAAAIVCLALMRRRRSGQGMQEAA